MSCARPSSASPLYSLRWPLLCMYAFLLLAGLIIALSEVQDSRDPVDMAYYYLLFCFLHAGPAIVFVVSIGLEDLHKPLWRKRLVIPCLIAGFLVSVLIASLLLSVSRAEKIPQSGLAEAVGHGFVCWPLATIVCIPWVFDRPRYVVLRRLTRIVILTGLIQLCPSILMVILCGYAGDRYLAYGLYAGFLVVLWGFVPGLLVLFLRPAFEFAQTNADLAATPMPFRFNLLGWFYFCFFLAAVLAATVVPLQSEAPEWTLAFVSIAGLLWLWRVLWWLRAWELKWLQKSRPCTPESPAGRTGA